jgi:putative oxygen-independent coproporphyrinogen III oxidase
VKPESLYIHIPFCAHLCAYCDFAKVLYEPAWALSYVGELKKEIAAFAISSVKTIYIGGGTPSVLPLPLLADLLAFVRPLLAEGGEFTLEANPENFTREKAHLLREMGVNRLSLGVQSSDESLLKMMGRHHSFKEAEAAFFLAREAGFANISCDLIYGLPGESMPVLEKDIEALLSLNSEHLSTYCLSVNPGTLFYNQHVQEMDQALAADQYEAILRAFRARGYTRYEVSNFAKAGHESRHNLTYWKDEPYYGAGLGAAGYIGDVRYTNTRDLQAYLKGKRHSEEEVVTPSEDKKYFFLTNLRLEEGFSLEAYQKRFHEDFSLAYRAPLTKLVQEGLLKEDHARVYPTDQGILLLDRVLLALY